MAPLHPDSPLERLAHHLSALTDPRSARRPVHLLDELLLMALGMFCTGGRTFVDMAHFAHGHQEWLRTFMELPGGLPSHDTFGHVFAALDARELEDALSHWCAGVESTESRCLITSLRPRAGESPAAFAAVLAGVVRAHWQIENSLHWRLDVLLGEDACRARSGEAAANLAVLRKITLNTLKLYPPLPGKKGQAMSIRSRQYLASIQPNYLASLLKNPALAN